MIDIIVAFRNSANRASKWPAFIETKFNSRHITLVSVGIHFVRPGRPQWPHSLRRWSAAVRLLGLLVRILSGAWMLSSSEFLCVVKLRSLWRSDHLSSRVIQNLNYAMSVIAKRRKGRPWPGVGSKLRIKKNIYFVCCVSPAHWNSYFNFLKIFSLTERNAGP